MACGVMLNRALIVVAALVAVLASASLAHGASTSIAAQARQLGSGCEPNGLPSSLAVCDGTGRLNVLLHGTAVLSVQGGRVTLKGKAERVCRFKRVTRKDGTRSTRRVCSKRAKPILPRGVETRQARGYTIYIGERLYFYLPAGNWRISAEGRGLSLSAVGEGLAGVKSRAMGEDVVAEPGLISVGGELYETWPRRWTKYDFGPRVAQDKPDGGEDGDQNVTPTERSRSGSAITAIAGLLNGTTTAAGDSKLSDLDATKQALEEAAGAPASAAGEAESIYSSDAQLPTHTG